MSDKQWYEHPSLILQVKALAELREELREKNLFEGEGIRPNDRPRRAHRRGQARPHRRTGRSTTCPIRGWARRAPASAATRRSSMTITHTKKLLDPDPRLISRKLMARDSFKPAGIVNSFAAAWIQFENHNWFFHGNGDPDKVIDIPLGAGDDFPQNPMQIRRTIPMNGKEIVDGQPAPVFANTETHWWDGSQIYGTGKEKQSEVRTFKDGKVKVQEDGRLPESIDHRRVST